jgi:hypothetical protein
MSAPSKLLGVYRRLDIDLFRIQQRLPVALRNFEEQTQKVCRRACGGRMGQATVRLS